MKNNLYIIILLLSIALSGCEDFLEPNQFDGTYSDEYIWNTPEFAEGVIMKAYRDAHPLSWRVQSNELMAVLTDDAVSSNIFSTPGNFAQGLQSPYYNLSYLDSWDSDYENIFNINIFLDNYQNVTFDPDAKINERFKQKYKGDAFFLRAWYHWRLLKRYGGPVGDQMMGVPVVKSTLELEDGYQIERATYMETVQSIVADCDSALKYVPSKYEGFDIVTGKFYYGSPTESIVRSLIGIVYAFAASPAYNTNNDIAKYDMAASKLAEALTLIDGSLNADALPERNFHEPENPDVIWRSRYERSNYANEWANYPPSLRGSGLTNPSQNLADEFGDFLGYPIEESTIYDSDNPYEFRDSRFYSTFVYNGSFLGMSGNLIETYTNGADSRTNYTDNGTRTGYYLRKLLSENVTLFPEQNGVEPTFFVTISKTDLYLLFAEAMNELGGPSDARYGLSATDALSKIRKRAGIVVDSYVESAIAAGGKDALRQLIRKERRVELCFEGRRYWDLRRWGETEEINVPVMGIEITLNNDSTFAYSKKMVEERQYPNIYAPIPNDEVIKMEHVMQNEGW